MKYAILLMSDEGSSFIGPFDTLERAKEEGKGAFMSPCGTTEFDIYEVRGLDDIAPEGSKWGMLYIANLNREQKKAISGPYDHMDDAWEKHCAEHGDHGRMSLVHLTNISTPPGMQR